MTPAVSVVVPHFNAQEFLSRCIESVLCQDLCDFELILVDDHSSDAGPVIAEAAAAADSRVIALRNSGSGANAARKTGVLAARASRIVFLDSDDELAPHALKTLTYLAESSQADLICTEMELVSGGRTRNLFGYQGVAKFDLGESPAVALEVRPSACAKLMRRDHLEAVSFADVPFAQDWNISYGVLALCRSVLFSEEVTYKYIRRPGSTCSVKREMSHHMVVSVFAAWRAVSDVSPAAALAKQLEWIRTRFFFELLVRAMGIRDRDERCEAVQDVSAEWRKGRLEDCFWKGPSRKDKVLRLLLSFAGRYQHLDEVIRGMMLSWIARKNID